MVERHGTDTMPTDQGGLTDRSSMRYCVECYADLVDDWQACWCFPNPPTLNEPWKKGEKDDS